MGKEIIGSITNKAGTKLFWRRFRPEGELRGSLIIAHGYAEHGNRYKNVFEAVLPLGIQVFALDQQGHGQSEGKRGYVERFGDFVDEQRLFYREVVEPKLDGKGCVMLGHSMGSVTAMMYASQYGDSLQGVVLSGTGTSLAGTPKILTALSKMYG